MSEHFLDRAQVGAALEQVSGEGVAKEVRVDALRLEPGRPGEAAKDEKGARPGERTALRVEEELGAVACVEERATAGEVAPQGVDRFAADRHDALLRALADAAHEASLEVDRRTVALWGIGSKSEAVAAGALAEVEARSR